jgi:UDP-N-acetylglucosamine 2-epimerase
MKKLRVMTVVGTRPEIIRLSRVLCALDQSEAIEHVIIHTGQNYDYELNQIFFEDLGLRKPDYFLEAAGKTATETIGNILIKIDPLLEELQQILVFALFQLKRDRFLFFIWKLVIVVLTKEYPKKPIEKL